MAALASYWLKYFSTSSPQPLNGFWRNLTGSKSSTPSIKFVFFLCRSEIQEGHPGLWLAETFFDLFSTTVEWILTKLDRKQILNTLYQVCIFRADRKSKMAALASDWLKHYSTSSPQLLNGFWGNLMEAIPQSPLSILCFSCNSEIELAETFFDFFSPTAEWVLMKLDRKQVLNALYQVCVFLVPIRNPRWQPWPLIGLNIFRLLLHNRWMDFNETW